MQQKRSFIERRNEWIHRAIELNRLIERQEDMLDDMFWFKSYLRLLRNKYDRIDDYFYEVLDAYYDLLDQYHDDVNTIVDEKRKLLMESLYLFRKNSTSFNEIIPL